MKNLLKAEELMMTIAAIGFIHLHDRGWSFLTWFLLFFLPDIGMLGYLINNKIGAYTYNLFHHKGLAIGLGIAGFCWQNEAFMLTGALLFAHASFDRIMGYGLKYNRGFHFTHLGNLKNKK